MRTERRPKPHLTPGRVSSRRPAPARSARDGFTLIELLVVVTIVVLVSAVTLPTVLPALSNRQVGEAARILQAALAGARDAAVRANAPRGIRLIPDNSIPGAVTASRIIPIEPAPDLTDGYATFTTINAAWTNGGVGNDLPPVYPFPLNSGYTPPTSWKNVYPHFFVPVSPATKPVKNVLLIVQALYANNLAPLYNPPTSWFWNVRIGDKLRFADAGRYYTVVGPMTVPNPELFVNDGPPNYSPYGSAHSSLQETYPNTGGGTTNGYPEFLFLVNGEDDNGDGYVDNGFDGINQTYDFDVNGGSAADDIGEWYLPLAAPGSTGPEIEKWLGAQYTQNRLAVVQPPTFTYTIKRRPVPTAGSRETVLPGGATIDLTTWDSSATQRERSRLPYDSLNGYVDVMLNASGQVVPFTEYSSQSASPMTEAFYHFWIADRSDVYAPVGAAFPRLPMPAGTPGFVSATVLKKDAQLVTLFSRSGQIVTKSISPNSFDATSTGDGANSPFIEAQLGIREAK